MLQYVWVGDVPTRIHLQPDNPGKCNRPHGTPFHHLTIQKKTKKKTEIYSLVTDDTRFPFLRRFSVSAFISSTMCRSCIKLHHVLSQRAHRDCMHQQLSQRTEQECLQHDFAVDIRSHHPYWGIGRWNQAVAWLRIRQGLRWDHPIRSVHPYAVCTETHFSALVSQRLIPFP